MSEASAIDVMHQLGIHSIKIIVEYFINKTIWIIKAALPDV